MRRPLVALSLLILAACAGPAARERVLWPALVTAWPDVRADVELGVGEGFAVGREWLDEIRLGVGEFFVDYV